MFEFVLFKYVFRYDLHFKHMDMNGYVRCEKVTMTVSKWRFELISGVFTCAGSFYMI